MEPINRFDDSSLIWNSGCSWILYAYKKACFLKQGSFLTESPRFSSKLIKGDNKKDKAKENEKKKENEKGKETEMKEDEILEKYKLEMFGKMEKFMKIIKLS